MSAVLRVQQPGLYTTIQDAGRKSFQHLGVPVSGAIDPVSMRLVNALVGNDPDSAVLEICFAGPTLAIAQGPIRVAISGSCRATYKREGTAFTLPPWQSVLLMPDDILTFGATQGSAYGYVAVQGGFDIPRVLGSASTYARAGIGGVGGRQLQQGDEIPVREGAAEQQQEHMLGSMPTFDDGPIRVMLGPQDDHFTSEAIETFLGTEYVVSQDSDRIGLRLAGATLQHAGPFEIPSEGTVNGSIQVPGSGLPIILLADRQTTGGYAKIATVISADLPRLSRFMPGSAIRFLRVDQQQAKAALEERAREFQHLIESIRPVDGDKSVSTSQLLCANLVSGFVSAVEGQ
jgi:biotin-dependent carboxylase-like uncharacterized protein